MGWAVAGVFGSNLDQLAGVGVGERFDQDGFYGGEDYGGCADADGDGEEGDGGECRSALEVAEEWGHLWDTQTEVCATFYQELVSMWCHRPQSVFRSYLVRDFAAARAAS